MFKNLLVSRKKPAFQLKVLAVVNTIENFFEDKLFFRLPWFLYIL